MNDMLNEIMQVLGKNRIAKRLEVAKENLK